MKQTQRIAYLVSHPIQYQAPFLRRLAAVPGVELTVYFLSDRGAVEYTDPEFGVRFKWDVPLLQGYGHVFVRRSGDPPGSHRWLNLEVAATLRRGRHDALIVHGYDHLAYWVAFAQATLAGIPLVLRGTSTLLDPPPASRRWLKGILLRALLSRISAALYIGRRNREFYEHYGVNGERLFRAPYCVDNAFFSKRADELRDARPAVRKQFGILDDRPVVLFCGKLIPKKRPLDLLAAFARVRRQNPCHLLFAGEGALRAEIERSARSGRVPDVHVSGFLNQSEVACAYSAADLMVLPSASRETWGVVVNEAMNFGLPVIVSDRVGCAPDLVREGVNGHVVPASDVDRLSEVLRGLVLDRDRRVRFGEASRRMIPGWSVDAHVEGILRAVERLPLRRDRRATEAKRRRTQPARSAVR